MDKDDTTKKEKGNYCRGEKDAKLKPNVTTLTGVRKNSVSLVVCVCVREYVREREKEKGRERKREKTWFGK